MTAYEALINLLDQHPGLLKIFEGIFCAWITLLCVAYKFGKYRGRIIDEVHLRKLHDTIDEEKERGQKYRIQKETFESEVARLKEVAHFRHWAYNPNANPPRNPICPKCNGRMKIADTTKEIPGNCPAKRFVPAFRITCPSCNTEPQIVYGTEMSGLKSAIGWISDTPEPP